MHRLRATLARAAAVAVLALSATGCLKIKEKTVVLPDGSGKYHLSMGMKKEMADMFDGLKKLTDDLRKTLGELDDAGLEDLPDEARELPANPLDLSPDSIEQRFQGFVGFTDPVRTEKDGWVTVALTGYFEDVNKVRAVQSDMESGENEIMTQYVFRKQGDGFVVESVGGMVSKMWEESGRTSAGPTGRRPTTEKEKAEAEKAKQLLRALMDGFEIATEVEMPGKVASSAGYRATAGRSARFWLSMDEMLDPAKEAALEAEMKKVMSGPQRIVCGASEVTEAQMKTFRDEMAAAQVAWQKRRADARQSRPYTGGVRPPGPPQGR